VATRPATPFVAKEGVPQWGLGVADFIYVRHLIVCLFNWMEMWKTILKIIEFIYWRDWCAMWVAIVSCWLPFAYRQEGAECVLEFDLQRAGILFVAQIVPK
jgi:hypothetical protein